LPDGTNSNTVEFAFGLLKRGIYGPFHHLSRDHLHRYVSEFDFRLQRSQAGRCAWIALAICEAPGQAVTPLRTNRGGREM
jgi:hypothetical protein